MPASYARPETPRFFVSRPRLLDRLGDILDKRVFLLVAPAGYGKTTAVAEYVKQLSVLSAWLPVDPSLSDPGLLIAALAQAIRSHRSAFGRHLADATQRGETQPRSLASIFFEELAALREPLVLVLDDFHILDLSIRGRYSVRDLMWAIMTMPELGHVHVVMTSRVVPALRMSRLRLEGQLAGLDQEALAFTTEEIRSYLEIVRGRPVSLADAERRHARTSGWIAGVVLSEASGPGNGPEGPIRPGAIFEYLDEELMPGLESRLRDFAVAGSALDELRPSLCDHALSRTDSSERLRELEQGNLFLERLAPVRGEPAFRFHALFREYLRSKLEPAQSQAIKTRAGDYHLMMGEWLKGARYLRDAENWPALVQALTDRGSQLIQEGQFADVRDILVDLKDHDALPDSLLVLYAETLIRSSEPELAEHVLSSLPIDSLHDPAEIAIARARAARLAGKDENALLIAEQELESRRCTVRQEAMLHRIAGFALVLLGRLDEAERHHMQALDRFDALHDPVEAACSKSDLGVVMVSCANHSRAERLFREAERTFRKHRRTDYLPQALNNLGSVLNIVGRSKEALQVLDEAYGLATRAADAYWRIEAAFSRGECLRALGDLQAARDAFQESAQAAWESGHSYRFQSATLWVALLEGELGHLQEARSLWRSVREQPDAGPRVTILHDLLALRMAWLEGDMNVAGVASERLILRAQELQRSRLLAFGHLFRTATLVRRQSDWASVMAELSQLLAEPDQAEDAVRHFPDVYAAIASSGLDEGRMLPSMARAWKRLSGSAAPQPAAPSVRRSSSGRPATLDVHALQPALRVIVDGRVHTGGWFSALDLFLYLVHCPQGGIGLEIAEKLWGDTTTSDRGLQQRFQSRLAFLRRILGQEAIVREGSARPGYYRLNPDIVVNYDVRQFVELGKAILSAPPAASQLPALEQARALHAESYWPARNLNGRWQTDIFLEVERLRFELLGREIELSREAPPRVAELDALRQEIMLSTGVGLREALGPVSRTED